MLSSRILVKSEPSQRDLSVDVLRGSAIVLMILFHFGYDLSAFGYTSYDTNADVKWRIFRAVIVSGFLLAVGMSSYLAYHERLDKAKFTKNMLKLFSVAVLISVGSLLMYPYNWVYFGIIHFIFVALPLSLLFLRHTNLALLLAMIILVGYFTEILTLYRPWLWGVQHLGLPEQTVDLVSFLPWFALILLGIFIMHNRLLPSVPNNRFTRSLATLGRHSLLIYLVHQPLLFSGFYLFQQFRH